MDSIDWNDLRYVVAMARSGSAAAAGRVLGVSHATVVRRIRCLEEAIGTALFDRVAGGGYVLTDAGRKLADVGTSIEDTLTGTQRLIDGAKTELTGTIRFTTTETFAQIVMPPILKSFCARHPAIKVDLIVTNARLDLEKREADVTLRPTVRPPESLVGKRLTRLQMGVYAAPAYLKDRRERAWSDLDWVMPGPPVSESPAVKWVRSLIREEQIALTADSPMTVREIVANGAGATIMPCFLATGDPRLELLEPMPSRFKSDLWLLTHANLRDSARIAAFMQHVAECVRADRSHFVAPGGGVAGGAIGS